ncbi:Phosphoglycerate mutase-like protein 2 [Hibiscus syriacus]|uniref:Phosphoglycerate mutase-like protein 2 n=1 Tax=Hibiscus syriacus TaxID=106335 RepID=A0A6A2WIJ8_HIBSY|nr:Phosphoglycerate mutase-like protein 2 [Hibiscus syriacus]
MADDATLTAIQQNIKELHNQMTNLRDEGKMQKWWEQKEKRSKEGEDTSEEETSGDKKKDNHETDTSKATGKIPIQVTVIGDKKRQSYQPNEPGILASKPVAFQSSMPMNQKLQLPDNVASASEVKMDSEGINDNKNSSKGLFGSSGSILPRPKLELQMFDGSNPRGWIRKCQKYFNLLGVPEEQKLEVATMYLMGKAETWLDGYIMQNHRMDATITPGLYPLHRCKTLHLVRHAQGVHNVAGEKDPAACSSEEYFDAHLTPLGWQQVDNLRKHVHETGLSKKVDLVIVSPLLRTMQTAVGVFGGEGYKNGIDVPPLMVANAGESGRPEISSLNCPPFVAFELCREILIESDNDVLWVADTLERDEDAVARGKQFLNWLWTRKEKEIAVVSHGGFLHHTLSAFGHDCHPSMKTELCKDFLNCELSSVVLVDRSMMGSDPATTNYPGKIPSGLDLPSAEKLADEGNAN